MRAAFFEEHGGLDRLQVGELPDPTPGEGEVVVRVHACALNHLDLFVLEGWPGLRLDLPHVGGTDLAGVVESVGPGVDDGWSGREVMVNPGLNFLEDEEGRLIPPAQPSIIGETRSGGLAQRCVVPVDRLLAKPDDWTWAEAAAFPLTALTVMRMLRKARAKAGDKVLIVGAGGGIGVMAVQLAKALGCEVFATTGGADKVEKVRSLGADHVVDYRSDDAWGKTVFLATQKQGMDIALDCVGEATWAHSLRSLAPGGRLVTCGATTGGAGQTDIRLVFWKQLEIHGSTMGSPEDLAMALALAQQGKVRPVVDSQWSLDEVRDALAKMERGEMFGKIIVEP